MTAEVNVELKPEYCHLILYLIEQIGCLIINCIISSSASSYFLFIPFIYYSLWCNKQSNPSHSLSFFSWDGNLTSLPCSLQANLFSLFLKKNVYLFTCVNPNLDWLTYNILYIFVYYLSPKVNIVNLHHWMILSDVNCPFGMSDMFIPDIILYLSLSQSQSGADLYFCYLVATTTFLPHLSLLSAMIRPTPLL